MGDRELIIEVDGTDKVIEGGPATFYIIAISIITIINL